MAAEVCKREKPARSSGAGSLHEILVELHAAARVRRVVVPFGADRMPAPPQPADDLPQLGGLEHPRCLLYGETPACQQVGKNLALGIAYHIGEV